VVGAAFLLSSTALVFGGLLGSSLERYFYPACRRGSSYLMDD